MFDAIKLSIPIKEALSTYKKKYYRTDIIAGLTVAGVAIPQAMAYAQLAGLNLTAGLYAAIVAMLVFGIFTSSKHVIMGPDAAMAALAGSAVVPLSGENPEKAIALVAVLSIFIGAFSVVSVFGRLSYLAEFLSRPILLGYMAGLALVVIATQLPKLFGIAGSSNTNILGSIFYLLSNLDHTHILTLIVGVCSLIIGLILTFKVKRLPAGLILLVVSIATAYFMNLGDKGVALVGEFHVGIPVINLDSVSWFDIQNLLVPAITMMVIAYANTISTGRAFARKEKQRVNPEQEFLGLGLSNLGSGLFGGLPVSASGVRTAVNYQSKAKSQISQLVGAFAIAIVVVFFAGVIKFLPIATLGAIIILAVIPLFNYKELRSIWHAWRSEALLAIITSLGVAFLGIYQGLLLAVFLAIANIFRKSAFPYDATLGVAKDGTVHDMKRPPYTKEIPGLKIYRFDAPLYFANANYFRRRVLQIVDEAEEPVKWFVWDAETVTHLDSTSGQMLLDLIQELKNRGTVFCVARMKGTIRNIVHHSHRLSRHIQQGPHFRSIGDAIEAYREEYDVKADYKLGK